MVNKICSRCKEGKALENFSRHKGQLDGYQWYCKPCMQEVKRFHRYGITPEEYNQLYVEQEGKCYICETHEDDLPRVLHVDHCHSTGELRRLLCSTCNTGLGSFKDSPSLLIKAAKYLE